MDMLIIKKLSKENSKKIFDKISIDKITKCWNWIGKLNNTGYGYSIFNGNQELTHRLMYALYITPIPKGLPWKIPVINHICNNRSCCNPKHLELTSLKNNILKGNGPTAINARKIYCLNNHLLPIKSNRRDGGRRCLICQKAKDKIYWQKRKPHYVRHKPSNSV